MLLRIVAIIFPLFAVVLAGYLYGRARRPDLTVANQMNLDVFVPALIFGALANRSFQLAEYSALALGGLAIVLVPGLLALPLSRWLGVQAKTFVPPMMFYNSGNLGLPLAVLAFGEQALAPAVVLFLITNLLHFSLGTYLLDHRARLLDLWRIPMLQAGAAGLAVSLLEIDIWPPLMTAVKMLGDVSIPLVLFALGVRLTDASFHAVGLGLAGAAVRPLAGMLVAAAAAWALPLPPEQKSLLFVSGALPPAVLNYVVAERYRQEPEKVASIVLLGNIAALLFIPIALALVLEG